jgi:imidazolonepropionase-like amidohydrolase
VRTDGTGGLVSHGPDDAPHPLSALPLHVDLVASALECLGEANALGAVRSALVLYEGAVVAIGRVEGDRAVVVVGEAQATPGLVLSHLHRICAGAEEP